jgi:hypothetical protein
MLGRKYNWFILEIKKLGPLMGGLRDFVTYLEIG